MNSGKSGSAEMRRDASKSGSAATCFSRCLALPLLAVATLAQAAPGPTQVSTQPLDRSEGLYAHEAMLVRADAQRLNWTDRLSEIRTTILYGAKLLALGTIHGSADAFVLGREPLVSPSGRFVSFMQFVPRQAQAEAPSDIVLIYDLQRASNEVGGVADDEGWVSRASNQGVIVYPGAPRSERVFPSARAAPGATASEVNARSWTRDGEQHLIVAAEGNDLAVLAVGAAPDGSYKLRQARVGARQAFGSASPGSWSKSRVRSVTAVGPNEVAVLFDNASGVPGRRLQLALR
ncbi:hypothetical protein [Rubrivivax sp. A210]|uniref:hypothetical protein n=1 Tax=Rubrivivax sp. A210 TaxID=2772301 RepID=UPI00191A31F9|nr:hypothetical protein [Rubrivivax sp. A210]